MPFNKIHVPQSLPTDLCKKINDQLHNCLVEECGVSPDDYFCLVSRYNEEDMIFHPTFLGKRDPNKTIVIEIALLSGRTDEQKENLYTEVRKRIESVGFEARNSIIYLLENNPIDWSFSEEGSVKKVLEI